MQQEAFNCLKALGFHPHFAGQEDPSYPPEITGADMIVTLAPPLARLPARCTGVTLLYACNTHVIERENRLQTASQKWQLSCESQSFRDRNEYLRAYERADYLLIAENEQGIRSFLKHGVLPHKIKRYNNCVDVDVWVPNEQKRDKFSFVCYASALGLRKGLPPLLAAWQQWYQEQDAELCLIGIPTPVSDQLLGGTRNGEANPGIHVWLEKFPAQHKPIIDLIGSCHVAIFPTLEDAQPSTLLEMTSCGLPVITTVESGVEFDPEFCRYIAADSVRDLCAAFEYWYRQRDRVVEIGQKARQYIIANHSWPCFRQRFNAILCEAAANAGIKIQPPSVLQEVS